ncbi:MAG: TraB/GumN family protein [Candidatus Nanohaloarchaea archaeon]
MIHIYGTSHVSQESLDVIDRALEEHDPDVVALELDILRLRALETGEKRSGGPLMLRLLKRFQDSIGKKTGLMPGEEMLYAYRKAVSEGREVALIDQDIQTTVRRLRSIRRKEKVKAVASLVAGFFLRGKFDISKIPREEEVELLVDELRDEFPGFHQVLMEERNGAMIAALEHVREDTEGDIVAFVGAAHKKPLQEALR